MLRKCVAATCGLALATMPAAAISLDDLKDVSIETQFIYDATIRRAEGIFKGQTTAVMTFQVDAEGRIRGTVTRTVNTPFGPRSRRNPIFARIGQPGEPRAGEHGLWLLEGDKLVLLRTLEQGGFKIEIEFKGSGKSLTCTARAPFVREEGLNEIKSQQSIVGGPVTFLSATEKSTKCRVVRQ